MDSQPGESDTLCCYPWSMDVRVYTIHMCVCVCACACVIVWRVEEWEGEREREREKKGTSVMTLYHFYHYLFSFCPRQASTALEALLTGTLSDEVIQVLSLHTCILR